jgi:hypothetical protein
MMRMETAVERLEKRLWLAVFGVARGCWSHGALALDSADLAVEGKCMEYEVQPRHKPNWPCWRGTRIAGYASVFGRATGAATR